MASEIPNMKTMRTHWGVLGLIAFIALVLAAYLLPPLSREKVRSQRRQQAVNNIAPVFEAKQSINPASAAPVKK